MHFSTICFLFFHYLEKLLESPGRGAAKTKDGASGLGPGAEVRDLSQELERMAFLLKRVCLTYGKRG